MRLTFFFPVDVLDDSHIAASLPDSVERVLLAEESLADYLDSELADLGVVGGEVHFSTHGGVGSLEVVFWMPNDFDDVLVERLREDTVIQLEDGLGEGGFRLQTAGLNIVIVANTEVRPRHEVVDDGRNIPKPSMLAICARDGDISTLKEALNADGTNIDQTLQGYTALQFAILFGHMDAALTLIEAGAGSNRPDPSGQTPLELCALSNHLTDEQSCTVARRLLEVGADPGHRGDSGESAKSYALLRQKQRLAAML